MPDASPSITPDTKVADLLLKFPHLEKLIDELLPSFARLKNPELRKSVAQTLTLEQGAVASGTRLPDVILKLRQAAGLPDEPQDSGAGLAGAPQWVKSAQVAKTIDARPLLAQGIHPKDLVMKEVLALSAGQALVLVTPFVPGPLIELGRSQGLQTWTKQGESGRFETYFGK